MLDQATWNSKTWQILGGGKYNDDYHLEIVTNEMLMLRSIQGIQ